MANEASKDFNAMLQDSKGMPKIQIITDEKSIEKYGGNRMYFAPPLDYDRVMRQVPEGKLITVGELREYFARQNQADFTDPITAGIFVSICAWASFQRSTDETPYWRTLKANGELNPKYPGGAEAQKGGFAAAGGADQADHVAAVDVDINALQHVQRGGGLLCARLFFAAVGLCQAADFQNLIGHFEQASSQTLPADG